MGFPANIPERILTEDRNTGNVLHDLVLHFLVSVMPFYDYGETPTKACLCWQHKWQGSLFSTAHCWRDWLVPERAALRRTKQLAPWDLNRKGGKKTVQVDLQLRETCLNRK